MTELELLDDDTTARLIRLLDAVETSAANSPMPSGHPYQSEMDRDLTGEEFVFLLLLGAGAGFLLYVLGDGWPF
jgi:hypothetical protein